MTVAMAGFKRLSAAFSVDYRKTRPISAAVVIAASMAAGAALYFSAEQRPDRSVLIAGLVMAGALIWLCRHFLSLPSWLALAGCGLALGAGVGELRVSQLEYGYIGAQLSGRTEVSGWLERIERSSSGRERLVIRVPDPAGWYRVRILGSSGALRPGEGIRVTASLGAPRPPVIPGGYDARYYAYFSRLQATGWALSEIEPVTIAPVDVWPRRLARWRFELAGHIRARLQGRAAGIAAAVLVGDRSGIDAETADRLRVAGLGHILAISGLHMALMAGGSFFGIRLLLALWSSAARRLDVAKPAALAALVISVVYLLLSGAAIPTQRAFIVTAVAFGAIIVGRRAISFQSFAFALGLVVLLQPESVLSPGFQMSFSAVGALIAVHEWRRGRGGEAGRVPGFLRPFTELGLTSLVAGSATAVIGAFHFNRIASFGLLGNLLAMPVFSFLVMPAGVIGLLLVPLGLDGPAFAVMQIGLDAILVIAEWVSTFPAAARLVPSMPGWWLLAYLCVAGMFLLGPRPAWRLVGAVVGLVLMSAWAWMPRPDLLITAHGVVTLNDGSGWSVSDARRDRFARSVFLESLAVSELDGGRAACDMAGCVLELEEERIAVPSSLEFLAEDCRRAQLVVLPAETPDWISRRCETGTVALSELEQRGNAIVWWERGRIGRIRYVDPAVTSWPWQSARS